MQTNYHIARTSSGTVKANLNIRVNPKQTTSIQFTGLYGAVGVENFLKQLRFVESIKEGLEYFANQWQPTSFSYNGDIIELKAPLQIDINVCHGGLMASYEPLNIVIFENTFEELKESFEDCISVCYELYYLADEKELSPDAMDLKNWFVFHLAQSSSSGAGDETVQAP